MHACAKHLGQQKRRPAKTAANIKNIHIRHERDQAENVARGSFAAGTNEIAPVDRFILANFVGSVLALIERVCGWVDHTAIPLFSRVTRSPTFGADSACGSMVLRIFCVPFFRAPRGKTAHQKTIKCRSTAGKTPTRKSCYL